jgi:nucleoside-diphosphate-sugar epimerase
VSDSRYWLVTGGAGFIGSHLVRVLVERGERVRVVDDFSTGVRERLAPFSGRFDLVEGTLTDPSVCARSCEGVTHLLHQAAIPSVQRSVEDPEATHAACATGTLNILQAAREAGVQRVVYAGSSSAYGDTPELPKRECMTPNPRSPYAVAKLAGEHYVRAFAGVYGLDGVVLRYFNVFGPGQDPASPYAAVVPKFITAALAGRAPVIHGDGEQTRDFTYIDNVVEANLRAAEAPAEAVSGRVFNVGCGDRISVNLLWREIRELTGAGVEASYGPARSGDVRDSLADVGALRQAIGFEPSVSLREGLRRTVEAFRGGT